MTQEELAYQADIDASYLGRIENGERSAGVDKLFGIAKALKVAAAELFRGL